MKESALGRPATGGSNISFLTFGPSVRPRAVSSVLWQILRGFTFRSIAYRTNDTLHFRLVTCFGWWVVGGLDISLFTVPFYSYPNYSTAKANRKSFHFIEFYRKEIPILYYITLTERDHTLNIAIAVAAFIDHFEKIDGAARWRPLGTSTLRLQLQLQPRGDPSKPESNCLWFWKEICTHTHDIYIVRIATPQSLPSSTDPLPRFPGRR